MPTFTTTGSTGKPKTFTISDETLLKRVSMRSTTKGGSFTSIKSLFCDLSLTRSSAGLTHQLWAKKNNVKFYTPTADMGSASEAIKLFQSENIEGIVANTQGLMNYAILAKFAAKSNKDYKFKFKCILATGSDISPDQSKYIRSRLGDVLYTSYGTSEVGSIALGTSTQIESIPGCVGPLCAEVQISFDSSKQILVKTSAMITKYDNDPDGSLTSTYFKDGWFCTGDFGRLTHDGLLVLFSSPSSARSTSLQSPASLSRPRPTHPDHPDHPDHPAQPKVFR